MGNEPPRWAWRPWLLATAFCEVQKLCTALYSVCQRGTSIVLSRVERRTCREPCTRSRHADVSSSDKHKIALSARFPSPTVFMSTPSSSFSITLLIPASKNDQLCHCQRVCITKEYDQPSRTFPTHVSSRSSLCGVCGMAGGMVSRGVIVRGRENSLKLGTIMKC
jgi:hypothetical protein